MDVYLSRCLKNWAAHQSPPAGGRERLLSEAAESSQKRKANPDSPVSKFSLENPHPTQDPNLHALFDLVKFWPLYLNTPMRLDTTMRMIT